ncbi:TPM domain-containing protein [Cryomorphaceae bacterium 1068]|nr:TPM domain-containing protein [Cryomorphaceae bacterium 1068]
MAQDFFTEAEKAKIVDAITAAENKTSGEIRLHIERKCPEEVLDRAAFLFEKLEMHKTELRNGVLFYVSFEDHKLAILGDGGINAVVPDTFWNEIKEQLVTAFKQGNYTDGLSEGIRMAGEQLKAHFPVASDDIDELSNEISFGKDN